MSEDLKKETELFEENKKSWLKDKPNAWVWILDNQFYFYDSYEEAVKAAYSKGYSDSPIFIKQITETDEEDTIAGIYLAAV